MRVIPTDLAGEPGLHENKDIQNKRVVVVDVSLRGDWWHKVQLRHKDTDVERSFR